MSKYLRDLKRIAEAEGFTYEGYAGSDSGGPGSGHHVFMHEKSGTVLRTSSTPKNEGHALKRSRSMFASARSRSDSKATKFKRWMLKRYKVGKNGMKEIDITVRELAEEYNQGRPESEQIKADHIGVMIGQDPMFERISYTQGGGGRGSSTTKIRIKGPAYGLVKEPEIADLEDACGSAFMTPDKGIAVCVLPAGHEGLHYDSFRKARWANGSGVPMPQAQTGVPVIDPVAQVATKALPKLAEQLAAAEPTQTPQPPVLEPVGAEVSVAGLTLSDQLADQLREALGVPDTGLAVESQNLALKALQDAQAALQLAVEAIQGVAVVKPSRSKHRQPDNAFGRTGRERIEMVKQAVLDGRLPRRFTTQDAQRVVGMTEGQAVSLLAKAHRIGDTFVRVAPNTYELRS